MGLNIGYKVSDHTTFSANSDRLFNEGLARAFFNRLNLSAKWGRSTSDGHFSEDGTFIDAWVSHKSVERRDDESGTPRWRNPEVDFKGKERCSDTYFSITDADGCLFKKN